jgi:hypothetical protein
MLVRKSISVRMRMLALENESLGFPVFGALLVSCQLVRILIAHDE